MNYCVGDELFLSDKESSIILRVVPHIAGRTNADRIRAMSDEELARVLNGDQYIDFCHKGMCLDDETCTVCMLRWLQQPAPEEGEQNVRKTD